jgi:hypothetical protein
MASPWHGAALTLRKKYSKYIAKMSVGAQQRQRVERNNQTSSSSYSVTDSDNSTNNLLTPRFGNSGDTASTAMPQTDPSQPGLDMWGSMDGFSIGASALEEDFFASLIDPKILDSFGANLMGGDLMDQSFFEGLDLGQGFGV